MKWILLLFCFVSISAFGQVDNNSVLEKLKKTDKLMGRDNYNNFQPKLRTVTPMQSETKQRNNERVVTSLPLGNMPCIVPNMNLFNTMPNVGSIAMLEHPTDPGIYLNKPNFKPKK